MINTVWLVLVGFGIALAIGTGKVALISPIIFTSANKAIQFTFGLAGTLAFWSGILKIAEASGITAEIAKFFQPVLRRLFPDLGTEKPILGLISLTLAANLLGLGNMATPLGLKTMTELQKFNHEPEKASAEICTFLTLVLGGLTLIPSTLIAIRSQAGSENPAVILGPVLIVTLAGTVVGLLVNYAVLKVGDWSKKE
ncbi:MAG: nucleoside recognition domain-containing protein [Bacillota bacterium]